MNDNCGLRNRASFRQVRRLGPISEWDTLPVILNGESRKSRNALPADAELALHTYERFDTQDT